MSEIDVLNGDRALRKAPQQGRFWNLKGTYVERMLVMGMSPEEIARVTVV